MMEAIAEALELPRTKLRNAEPGFHWVEVQS